MPPERVRLRIANLAKAVLVSGQAYQDPKDALNYVVYNNPRAPNDELAEQMVGMLVRVRRHLPRRR